MVLVSSVPNLVSHLSRAPRRCVAWGVYSDRCRQCRQVGRRPGPGSAGQVAVMSPPPPPPRHKKVVVGGFTFSIRLVLVLSTWPRIRVCCSVKVYLVACCGFAMMWAGRGRPIQQFLTELSHLALTLENHIGDLSNRLKSSGLAVIYFKCKNDVSFCGRENIRPTVVSVIAHLCSTLESHR